jgi:hypothetical protein
MSRLSRVVAAATALTAATAVALTGSASAMTPAGGAYTGTSSATMTDGSTTPAPTQNLANLSRNMWVASKSVDAAVHFDRGLTTLGANVVITVSFTDRRGFLTRITQSYNNTSGNRFATTFGVYEGDARQVLVDASMTERTANGTTYTYHAGRSFSMRPLWDVTLSPLKFTLLSDCDAVGDSEIWLYFSHSAAYGTVLFDLGAGQSHIVNEFAKTWTEVGVSDDLRVPIVHFSEQDPWAPTKTYSGQELSEYRLLPGLSYHESYVVNESYNQCQARIDYDNIITLRNYNV